MASSIGFGKPDSFDQRATNSRSLGTPLGIPALLKAGYAVDAMPAWLLSSTQGRWYGMQQYATSEYGDPIVASSQSKTATMPFAVPASPVKSPYGPVLLANTRLSSRKSPCTTAPLGSVSGTFSVSH